MHFKYLVVEASESSILSDLVYTIIGQIDYKLLMSGSPWQNTNGGNIEFFLSHELVERTDGRPKLWESPIVRQTVAELLTRNIFQPL